MINKKRKILFRMRSMETGGVQKVLLNILQNLDKDRFEITLLLNLNQGELLNEIPDTIKIHYIGQGKQYLSKSYFKQKYQLLIRRIKLYFYNRFPLILYNKYELNDQDVEVAFFHYNFKEILNSPNKKSKKIGWFHSDIRNTGFSDAQNIEIINYMNEFDTCVFVSNQSKNIIENHYKIKVNNSLVIHNPIDVNSIIEKSQENVSDIKQLYENKDYKIFFSIGRITIGKGYQLLLEVHKKLIDNGLYHKIYIIGTGNYQNEIEKKIEEYNLKDTFLLLGEKKNPYPYLKSADYFVLPSYSEAYPLVIAESLILEKPIITTDVGGIREMMEDLKNGIFVKSKNEDELYKAMELFLRSTGIVENIQINNKACKVFFNPKNNYNQIENLFIK